MEKYFVEFSPQQGCFHISTESEMICSNRKALSNGITPQYFAIDMANSHKEASAIVQQHVSQLRVIERT